MLRVLLVRLLNGQNRVVSYVLTLLLSSFLGTAHSDGGIKGEIVVSTILLWYHHPVTVL